MNKERRKLIHDAVALMEQAKALLEEAAEGEREFYDNMPESIQLGEKGDRASEVADQIEAALDGLDNVIADIDGAAE